MNSHQRRKRRRAGQRGVKLIQEFAKKFMEDRRELFQDLVKVEEAEKEKK